MNRSHPMLVAAVVLSTAACGAAANRVVVDGECADVHGADVCTWATLVGSEVVEFGATVPMASVDRAPEHAEMHWPPHATAVIRLPEEARTGTGFQTLTVYWEPHGHPPGPYMYPHFDFHFYHVDEAMRATIDCADESKPERLPAGYILPDEEIPEMELMLVGICVPGMGMHAVLDEEFHGTEPFTGTMVIGYYGARSIFVEPMITQELLQRRTDFELDVPRLDPVAGVRYPTRFQGIYVPETDAYRFVFSGL